MVEEFAADRADHALGERVLPRGARCGEDLGDADALHPLSKLAAVDAVAIAEEEARRRVMRESLDDLLRRPSSGGGLVEVHDLAAMMQQDHEHVEHAEGRSRHNKEVDGDEVGEVVVEDCSPGLRGWLPATWHEPGNGALRNFETELE